MYATIRIYSGDPGFADALVENQDAVRRIISEIDGFRAYYLLKTADGTASVSVYEDEAGATESTRAAAAWIAENLPDTTVSAPQVISGEAVISA
jgi:heme-degrading monooxygenase HmoA